MNDPVIQKIRFNPKRLLFAKIIWLTILIIIFYIELLVNMHLLNGQFPLMINYLVIVILVILFVLEILIAHIKAKRYSLDVRNSGFDLHTNKHHVIQYAEIHSLDFERTGLDRIFGTGTLIINKRLRIIGLNNPHNTFYFLQKRIPRYN